MPDRQTHIQRFLSDAGWGDAGCAALAGDASSRRYLRLTGRAGQTAVLMDAPPDSCGSQAGFVHIANHLRGLGLAAPEVFAADLPAGLLLLEDLGDTLFATAAQQSPETETRLYEVAIDVLIHLRRPAPDELTHLGPAQLADMAALVFGQYCTGAGHPVPDPAQQGFHTAFRDLLARALTGPAVMALRDYHAENLVWRPGEKGLQQAGLLDFQDAFAGHPAYDVVSLLQDARRDLPDGLEQAMIDRYVRSTGIDPAAFTFAYHAIGVQRHLRILGVFARLSLESGKSHYLAHVPRTWSHLQHALDHPELAQVADMLAPILPAPNPDILARLGAA